MNRLLFFIILTAVVVLIDFYAYQGLKVAVSPLPVWGQKLAKYIFWGLTGITILTVILFEPMAQNPTTRKILAIVATIGLANVVGKILFALWLLVDDIIRLSKYAMQKLNPEPADGAEDGEGISRKEFLTQAGAISALIPLSAMTWGVVSGAHDYRVLNRTLVLPNLPQAFDGMKITQISDIHTGSFWNRRAVERGIELVNAQKSEMIFFTGDLVNNVASELNGWTDVFAKLRADMGVYSVLGNHDYGDYTEWSSPEAKRKNLQDLMDAQRQMGWDLLMNENRKITIGNESISVLGIENWGGRGRFPKYGDMKKAVVGTEGSPVKLLLSHDPSHWRAQVLEEYKDIDVMFSGHTHGFQFGIEVGDVKWSPVKYFYPEWADLYQENGQQLYVNRGFGYIGYPGRFGILPEITVFTLKRA